MRLPELDFPRFPMAAWGFEAQRPDSGGRLDLGCCFIAVIHKYTTKPSHTIDVWRPLTEKIERAAIIQKFNFGPCNFECLLVSVFQESVVSPRKIERFSFSFCEGGGPIVLQCLAHTIESCPFLREVFRHLEPFSTPQHCSIGFRIFWQWPTTTKNSQDAYIWFED